MEELWYQNVAYEDAKDLVKENLANTVSAFIAAGYWLKCIRDRGGYVKDGYQSIWECAEMEFGLKISEASRAMSMNDKYSVGGNSPFICDTYRPYNKSQLQEMLTMSDEQIEMVTPDMTIRAIREIKNHEAENPEMIQSRLEEWTRRFVSEEYEMLSRLFDAAVDKNINEKMLWAMFDDRLCSNNLQEAVLFDLVDGRKVHLVDKDTGEVIAEYDHGLVVNEINRVFLELREREHCDVATDLVSTECEEALEEDFVTEIEVVPETEESLNIEFDTDELMQELENVIDGEYQEVPEEKSAYGLTKTEYPEGSLIATEGCGHKYYCSDCALDCVIRQKARYCRCAPLGNPYDCTTMNMLENLKNEMGSKCQFIDMDLAEHNAGDGAPDPCCKNCKELCGYRCRKSASDKKEDAEKPKKLELPQFKNNEQRKAWLEDVEAWGLWYEDENIQARYYKYDFPDGNRIIAVKYRYTCPQWMLESDDECFNENKEADGDYKDTYYHMTYSEEYRKNRYEQYGRYDGPYERYYTNSTVSVSILVEYLKQQQKKKG